MNLNLQTPKKQAGIWNFLAGPAMGNILGGLGGIFGGAKEMQAYNDARKDIKGLPGMSGPVNVAGNFGSSRDGTFQMDAGLLAQQQMLGATGLGLLGGGMFNDPRLQAALGQNDIAGALGQSNAALQQMMPGTAYGNQQGLFNALQSGALNNLGSFQDTQNAELQAFRNAAQPEMQRQQNQLFTRAQAMGMGLPSTGEMIRSQQTAFNEQDLGFQKEAFNRALQRQGLGLQQGQQAMGMESQMFGQGLQALQQNQSAGMNRLNQAMGLFSGANDIFSKNYGLGLQGAQGALGFGDFGLRAAGLPYELQAELLSGSGYHAQALGGLAEGRGQAGGGFLSGLGGAVSGIAKGIGSIFSDRRLKKNLKYLHTDDAGNRWYKWTWNSQAKLVGAHHQPEYGVIAQEVETYFPEAVFVGPGGYKMVDYDSLTTMEETNSGL